MNNDIIQKNNDDISHHLLQWPSLDRKCPVPAHQKLTNTLAAPQQGIFQIEATGHFLLDKQNRPCHYLL